MTALNKQALLIENGQLVADTLRHLADNEIDSDYFAITSTNENGTEIDYELVITDYALQAAGTVEELVKALESAEKRIAEQSAIVAAAERLVRCKGRYHSEQNYRALAALFGVTTPDLPPLEHENVHYADAAEMEIAALRQRIAELESNEIREDGNQFLVVRHPGKTPAIKHCSGDLEEFLRQLIEQDPLVTIDIITHRHYGVGGQWVQDGDEYLHMMTAAGIGVKGE